MACSKDKEAETTSQTRACVRTETIRDVLAKNSLVYFNRLLSYADYQICGERAGRGEGEGGCEGEIISGVCVWHIV